jgi:DNA polymerase (family 10)
MDRREIAHVMRTMGALLEIKGEDSFKVRAYEKAAERLAYHDYDLPAMAREGRLVEIPGIGKNLEPKLRELIQTGRSSFLERLFQEVPEGLLDLLRVPGIGPKTARLLHESLGVAGLQDLKVALQEHRVQSLPGLGKKREELMEKGLREIEKYSGRLSIGIALPVLENLVGALSLHGVRGEIVGETRRYEETVASLDVLIQEVGGESPASTLARTAILPSASQSSLEQAWDPKDRAFAFRTSFGVALRLHFEDEQAFWARAISLTGPASFVESLAKRAKKKGYRLEERGFYQSDRLVDAGDETGIFGLLDMCFVPPEARHRPELIGLAYLEGGEGEPQEGCERFDFVSTGDIKGDLHVHTSWSDGVAGIEDMVQKARSLGYSYLAITDHATDLKLIRGLTPERLEAQLAEIRDVSRKYPDVRVLTGVEVDILKDGQLYLPDDLLSRLDLVVASVHQDIGDAKGELVNRLVKAVANPNVDLIGHPTGRLIGRRPGHQAGLGPVFEAAAASGTALEINSSPQRLDLPEELAAAALEAGATFAICTDAHSPEILEDMRFGVYASARRAGIPRDKVLNARERPQEAMKKGS